MNSLRNFTAALGLLMFCASANAGVIGLLNGRSVAPDSLPDKSVEFGLFTGEYDDIDLDYFGGRFNFRASPELVVFGDLGQLKGDGGFTEVEGVAFGIGGYYVVEGVFADTDFAVRASLHRTDQEDDDDRELETTVMVVEAVFSGRSGKGSNGNIGWYGNLGMHRIDPESDDFETDTETEIGFGGGIVVPTSNGQFYAGIDMVDDMTFGGGYRHFLK